MCVYKQTIKFSSSIELENGDKLCFNGSNKPVGVILYGTTTVVSLNGYSRPFEIPAI